MRAITVDTKLIALIGDPLRQSYSSRFHNTTYEELGMDYLYLPVEVTKKDNLSQIIEAVKVMNFAGLAVTKPYKEEIMPYLDEIDEKARQIGSCNTIVITDGKLKGYNTDGIGAITSLEIGGGISIQGKTYFCFGAGGTSKSVCFELASHGAKRIYIVDIDACSHMCDDLAARINAVYPGVAVALRQDGVREGVADSDVLLNLTGLGMAPHEDKTPLEKNAFNPKHICFDATYNPDKTRFLLEAEDAGCRIINGLGMLAYQGARQVQLWTRELEPVELMFRHLSQLVGK